MVKANRQSQKIKQLNEGFDTCVKALEDISRSTKELMPLVAVSLELTIKLVRLYKESFNAGIKHAKTK